MADLETALNDLLADPNAMGQLLSLAGQLGLDSVLSLRRSSPRRPRRKNPFPHPRHHPFPRNSLDSWGNSCPFSGRAATPRQRRC